MPADRLRRLLEDDRPRRSGRRKLSGLQGGRHRRLAAAARVEVGPRPPGLPRHGRSVDERRRGRAAARLHRQRHLVGSADRRVSRPVRRPRRSRRAACCASSIPRRSATTACGCCAPCSSPRDSSSRSNDDQPELCRAIPLDDLPAERIWGEIEKLLFAPRPSIGLALALELGVVGTAVSGASGARRLSAGTRVASRGRRLGAHAAGHGSGADARRRSAAAAADRRHAGRGLPRLRQAGDDRVPRRPDPIDRSRGAGRGAGNAVSRSAERALDRRLRRARAGARHRRRSISSRGCGSRPGRGRRRRVPAPRAEGGPRTARAAREVRLPRPRARRASTATRWTGSWSARGRSAWTTARRRRSCSAATCWRSACARARASAKS